MPNNIYLKLNWKCTLYSCKSMDKLVKNAVHECIPKIGGSDFQFPRSKNHIMRYVQYYIFKISVSWNNAH